MTSIENLRTADKSIAIQIYNIMQAAYKMEAKLIGVTSFPPLCRSVADIQKSETTFWGIKIDGRLCGAMELNFSNDNVSIDSMVVHPQYFRQGIASMLLENVLENAAGKKVCVQTAVENLPAIGLYKKHGFREDLRWSENGFNLVRLTT